MGRIAPFAKLALVATLLAACELTAPSPTPGPSASATATPSPTATPVRVITGGNLRVALAGAPASLDPRAAAAGRAQADKDVVTRQIFEGLVATAPDGFALEPALATKWTASADGLQWTFTLRDGVTFHDGTAFNAAAVVANFTRSVGPIPIGAKVDARGSTVVFTLAVPYGPFPTLLALPQFAIVSPKSLTDDPAGWMSAGSKGAAGTGPFVFRPGSWQGDQLSLEKNAGYWQRGPSGALLPYLDRVTFRFLGTEASGLAELRSGGADLVRVVTAADLGAIRADPNLAVLSRPPSAIAYLGVSVSVKPFDLVSVRRALAMGIDRQAIVRALYGGEAQAATQFLPPTMLGHDDTIVAFAPYDVDAAKRIIADPAFPPVFATLWYPPVAAPWSADPRRVAESVGADLARIGVGASPKTIDPVTFGVNARDGRLELWIEGASLSVGDPDELLGAFFVPPPGKDATEGGGWVSPETAGLLRRARTESDESKRAELYKQSTKFVQRDVPRIPLVFVDVPAGATKKVNGFAAQWNATESYAMVWLGR